MSVTISGYRCFCCAFRGAGSTARVIVPTACSNHCCQGCPDVKNHVKRWWQGFPDSAASACLQVGAQTWLSWVQEGLLLDDRTRGMVARLVSYNAELKVFADIQINFDFQQGGNIKVGSCSFCMSCGQHCMSHTVCAPGGDGNLSNNASSEHYCCGSAKAPCQGQGCNHVAISATQGFKTRHHQSSSADPPQVPVPFYRCQAASTP